MGRKEPYILKGVPAGHVDSAKGSSLSVKVPISYGGMLVLGTIYVNEERVSHNRESGFDVKLWSESYEVSVEQDGRRERTMESTEAIYRKYEAIQERVHDLIRDPAGYGPVSSIEESYLPADKHDWVISEAALAEQDSYE